MISSCLLVGTDHWESGHKLFFLYLHFPVTQYANQATLKGVPKQRSINTAVRTCNKLSLTYSMFFFFYPVDSVNNRSSDADLPHRCGRVSSL